MWKPCLRRLYLPEINARNQMRAQAPERTAINTPMQGTAADMIKNAMLVDAWLQRGEVDARMIMQVHDELVFEVAVAELDTVRTKILRLMSEAAEQSISLLVESGVGNNWDEPPPGNAYEPKRQNAPPALDVPGCAWRITNSHIESIR